MERLVKCKKLHTYVHVDGISMALSDKNNIELIQEELEALQAIFCEEGEFVLHSDVENGLFVESQTLDLTIDLEIKRSSANPEARKIKMAVTLSKDYPEVVPKVALSSADFQNKYIARFKDDLMAYAHTLPHGPMILDLTLWLQENAVHTLEEKEEKSATCEVINDLVILKLDHMRNQTKYLKTLSSWTQDLNIKTVVFFLHKLILLVCEGLTESIREFLRRFKSCNIDVDSSGKPCKEKMMSFIVQMQRHFKMK